MKCIYCQGAMVRKAAPFHIDRKGYHLLFDAIPAWVCNQCGEAYFEETEVDAIQAVLRKIDQETEKLAIAS
ncbi:MAG: YgiT-type zinc finger protein [Nitrospirae bacterium]|nr:YgiT-type zinc finger protein [Nitrospirota bacterium]